MQEDSLPAETKEAQKYWSGQPIPSLGDLPDPGVKLVYPALQGDSLPNYMVEKVKMHCQRNFTAGTLISQAQNNNLEAI